MAVDIHKTRIRFTNVAIDGIYVVFELLVTSHILDLNDAMASSS